VEESYKLLIQVWKKQSVSADHYGLSVYDFIRNEVPLTVLKFSQMVSVAPASREYMSAPFALAITFALPFNDEYDIQSEMGIKWKDAVIDAGDLKDGTLIVCVCCDSQERMDVWEKFIGDHIAAFRVFEGRERA
jgi:hypothetical protein